jgi:lipopolysaccharide/colanic/teichoic acid biosynthesis glycosyltransferase
MYLRESSVDEFGGPRGVPQRLPGPSRRRVAGGGIPARRARDFDVSLRRCFDVVLALTAIVVFLPLLFLIGVAIKIQDGGPILFSQERIGKGGLRFRCYKFRSMRPDAEAYLARLLASQPCLREEWEASRKLKVDPRITLIGDFLRRSSLDELPQLFNILKGDMSLVGPRPIVAAEAENYGRWFRFYLAVRPGLTGLWQVSGRNDVSYRRRVAMDRLYVQTRSVKRYIWIVLATVPAVLYRRGSY